MVFEEGIFGVSEEIVTDIGKVALLLEGLGIMVILWLVFQIIFYMYNRRRMKEVYAIKEDMVRIEGKIDNILRKVSKKG